MLTKFIVLFHTLLAYNSFLVHYKVCSSDPRECLCTQAEGMVKPLKRLVLIQHDVERIHVKMNQFRKVKLNAYKS